MVAGDRIVFMGTPDFAVPVLAALCESGHQVVGVVTQPDKPVGRNRQPQPTPVKAEAQRRNVPLMQPVKVRQTAALQQIEAWQPDVLVTCAYGQLLPQRLLDIPTCGSLNVHASLLPRWRGAAPIQRAIMAGDTMTGIAIMEMVAALDAGPVYATASVEVGPDDDFGGVHDRLAAVGGRLLVDVLPDYLLKRLPGTVQDETLVTYAHRIERTDEWIHWNQSAAVVHNHVRALHPWPGASARVGDQTIKIWTTQRASDIAGMGAEPGVVVHQGKRVLVACREGWVELGDVQPAGKRRMSSSDWLRGLQGAAVRLLGTTDTVSQAPQ